MGILTLKHRIRHHVLRIKGVRLRTPEASDYLSDPMVAAAFLVFGMIALVLSVINFTQALAY